MDNFLSIEEFNEALNDNSEMIFEGMKEGSFIRTFGPGILSALVFTGTSFTVNRVFSLKKDRKRIQSLIDNETDPEKRLELKQKLELLDSNYVKLLAKMKKDVERGKEGYSKLSPEEKAKYDEKAKILGKKIEKVQKMNVKDFD